MPDFIQSMQAGYDTFVKNLTDAASPFSTDLSWSKALEQMSKRYAGPGNQGNQGEVFERVLEQGKAYVAMLEKLYQSASNNGQVDFQALAQQWLETMTQNNSFLQGMQGLQGLHGMSGLGNGFNFGNFDFGKFDLQSMFSPQHYLNMPSFGLNREHQERQLELIKLTQAYQKAMHDYQALQHSSLQLAIEKMQSKLEARNAPGQKLDSIKAVYDLWIDALEEAFAEIALSPAYQTVYGALVDAQMRVRANIQKQIEIQTGQFGMPTRTELEGVHQKLAQFRRSVREELAALKAELAELKSARRTIKTELQSAVVSAPAEAKTPAKAATKVSSKTAAPSVTTSSVTKSSVTKSAAKKIIKAKR